MRTEQLFANFHLYDHEVDFIFNLIKTDKPRAIKFNNTLCFIDEQYNLI